MEINVNLPHGVEPCTMREILQALISQKLEPIHEHKNWGDWIRLDGCETVISIEVLRGLSRSATIEHSEDDAEDVLPSIFRALHGLGWIGVDADGEFQLI